MFCESVFPFYFFILLKFKINSPCKVIQPKREKPRNLMPTSNAIKQKYSPPRRCKTCGHKVSTPKYRKKVPNQKYSKGTYVQ